MRQRLIAFWNRSSRAARARCLCLWRWISSLTWPRYVAGVALLACGFSFIALRSVDFALVLSAVELHDIPELSAPAGSDFVILAANTRLEMPSQQVLHCADLQHWSLSVPSGRARPCEHVELKAGTRQGDEQRVPTLTISPRDPHSKPCALSVFADCQFGQPGSVHELSLGQQMVVLVDNANAGASKERLLLERTTVGLLSGELAESEPLRIASDGWVFHGRVLDTLSAYGLTIREAYWDAAKQSIRLIVHADLVTSISVDGRWLWPEFYANQVSHRISSNWPDSLFKYLLGVVSAWLIGRKRGSVNVPRAAESEAPRHIATLVVALGLSQAAPALAQPSPGDRNIAVVAALDQCPPPPTQAASCPQQAKTSRKPADIEAGRELIVRTAEGLAGLLRSVAGANAVRLHLNPTASDLRMALQAARGPAWIVYVGHGELYADQSHICLRDGPLKVEELLMFLRDGWQASVWLYACKSANVDVRRPDTSVFAASPCFAALGEVTDVSKLLTQALGTENGLATTDANTDGVVTDRELFDALWRHKPKVNRLPALLKLRPAWRDIPLFELQGSTNHDALLRFKRLAQRHPSLTPLIEREQSYRAGHGTGTALPEVVWVADSALASTELSRTALLVGPLDTVELNQLSDFVLVARVWVLEQQGDLYTVRDSRDSMLPPLLESARWNDLRELDRGLEERLLLTPGIDSKRAGQVRKRFTRPPVARDYHALTDGHFIAWPCSEPIGQCFLAGGVRP